MIEKLTPRHRLASFFLAAVIACSPPYLGQSSQMAAQAHEPEIEPETEEVCPDCSREKKKQLKSRKFRRALVESLRKLPPGTSMHGIRDMAGKGVYGHHEMALWIEWVTGPKLYVYPDLRPLAWRIVEGKRIGQPIQELREANITEWAFDQKRLPVFAIVMAEDGVWENGTAIWPPSMAGKDHRYAYDEYENYLTQYFVALGKDAEEIFNKELQPD